MNVDNAYLVDALRATPAVIAQFVHGLAQEQERKAPEDGWSIVQVICHMRDNEERALERTRLMRDQTDPFIAAYDQEKLAKERNYASENLENALEAFRRLREQHTRELGALAQEQWERAGRHEERGTTSIETQSIRLLCHDSIHAAQICRLLGLNE